MNIIIIIIMFLVLAPGSYGCNLPGRQVDLSVDAFGLDLNSFGWFFFFYTPPDEISISRKVSKVTVSQTDKQMQS